MNDWVMVDIEADGPCPGLYSMIEIGAVFVRDHDISFQAYLKPVSDESDPNALNAIGVTRADTYNRGRNPMEVMREFRKWLLDNSLTPRFVSDNNGFDWQFINYYFWMFCDGNPFGHSSTNLGSLYKGLMNTMRTNFKHLRQTKHTHNALDDAKGNAEAMSIMFDKMGLNG